MLLQLAIFSSLLLPHVVSAAPGLDSHTARRNRQLWTSRVLGQAFPVSDAEYNDPNWAGAVWEQGDNTFNFVTGTFTVPTPSGPDGTYAAIWVGIDGSSCQGAILQTGIAFVMQNGQPNYSAWYEWFPAPWTDFSGISISTGDVIRLNVTASSSTSGTATVENLTNGQTVSENLSSSASLCGQNAEWIVEDFSYVNGSLVPFADFGTVTFTNTEATGAATYTSSGADIYNIEQNNQVLTSVSIDGSSVTIQYV